MTQTWIDVLGFGRKRARRRRRDGDFARDAGDWPRAIGAYEAYLAMCPEDWVIRVQLGHAYKGVGDLAAAEGAYRNALVAAPNNADVLLQLGHVLKLAGRRDEAREAYRRSVVLDPAEHAAAELAMLDRDNGDAARDAGQWLLAARHYGAYLKAQPHDWAIWVQLGNMWKEAGSLAEAERNYRKAIELDSSPADAFLQLGHLLKLVGKREEAIEAYKRSAALDTNNSAVLELVALGVARADFLTTLEDGLTENSVSPRPATGSLSLQAQWKTLLDAQAARDQRKWDSAAVLYRIYLSTKVDADQAWADMAFVLRCAERYHEAYDAIQRAVALAPDAIALMQEQALILRHLGKTEASTALFMRVMQRTGSAELIDDTNRPLLISELAGDLALQ